MKRTIKIMAMASVLGCLTFSSAWAAQADAQNNSIRNENNNKSTTQHNVSGTIGMGYGRMYHPQTVETIRGQVVGVETSTRDTWRAVHLQVKTKSGTISVFLGPSWFIDNQQTQIQPNAEVVVSGSKTTVNGQTALIASEVRTGGQILQLRDQNGRPAWAAWRRQGPRGPLMGQNMMGQGMMNRGMMNQQGMTGQGATGESMMNGRITGRGAMGGRMMEGGPRPGGMMAWSGKGGNMHCKCGRMMAHHGRRIVAKLEQMQNRLDKKVDRMNETTGKEKLNAMSSVINELVKQRDQVFDHIEQMVQHHTGEHRHAMMGGSEYGMGGWGHSHGWGSHNWSGGEHHNSAKSSDKDND